VALITRPARHVARRLPRPTRRTGRRGRRFPSALPMRWNGASGELLPSPYGREDAITQSLRGERERGHDIRQTDRVRAGGAGLIGLAFLRWLQAAVVVKTALAT
jgi:hypothetical protein